MTTGYWGYIHNKANSFIAFIPWKGKIKEKNSIHFCSSITELLIVYRTIIIRQCSSFVFTSLQPSHLPDILPRSWILLFFFVGLLFFSRYSFWFNSVRTVSLSGLLWNITRSFFRLWLNADHIHKHLKTRVLVFSSPAFPFPRVHTISSSVTNKQRPVFCRDGIHVCLLCDWSVFYRFLWVAFLCMNPPGLSDFFLSLAVVFCFKD